MGKQGLCSSFDHKLCERAGPTLDAGLLRKMRQITDGVLCGVPVLGGDTRVPEQQALTNTTRDVGVSDGAVTNTVNGRPIQLFSNAPMAHEPKYGAHRF